MRAGADVFRINMSHTDHAALAAYVRLIREIEAELSCAIGILADLQGPKLRIGAFEEGSVHLRKGDVFVFDSDPAPGDASRVRLPHPEILAALKVNDTILIDDGRVRLHVVETSAERAHAVVDVAGRLSNRKGVSLPDTEIPISSMTPKDRADLDAALKEGVDWVAISFVQRPEDVIEVKQITQGRALVMAKIEKPQAITRLEEVIEVSDALMVARGDLGVEMGHAALTGLQKTIIHQTRHRNRVVITATQMMESMISSPVPTRAEVSDVANAVMDGTDAVMLSAETAAGKYPVKAVAAMAEVIEGAETYHTSHHRPRERTEITFAHTDEAIAHSVMYAANHMHVRAIVALTESGSTTLWMSRLRSDIPIYAFTRHEATRRRVTLYRGVYPVMFEERVGETRSLFDVVFGMLLDLQLVDEGDYVILTKGERAGVQGGTNSMQILQVHR